MSRQDDNHGFVPYSVKQKFRHELMARATPAEKKMRSIINSLGLKYVFQKPISKRGFLFFADFYLPQMATIIEVDGGYHNNQENKDYQRTMTILQRMHSVKSVLRYTNEQVFNQPNMIIEELSKLKPFRMVPGIKKTGMRSILRKQNKEIERVNQIRSIVACDPVLKPWEKTKLIKSIP